MEGEAAAHGSDWSVISPYDSKRLTAHKAAKNINGRDLLHMHTSNQPCREASKRMVTAGVIASWDKVYVLSVKRTLSELIACSSL